MSDAARLTIVVEGPSDEAVVSRLARDHGWTVGAVNGLKGKPYIDQRLQAFNRAAAYGDWLVVRDLDADAECAAALARRLLPHPTTGMRFRIAVRQLEAWLLADVEGIVEYFRVRRHHVPADPDGLPNPKRALVALARRSSSRAIREEMAPEPGTTAIVGPGFVGRIIEFSRSHWSWSRAASRSDSLRRCIARIATTP